MLCTKNKKALNITAKCLIIKWPWRDSKSRATPVLTSWSVAGNRCSIQSGLWCLGKCHSIKKTSRLDWFLVTLKRFKLLTSWSVVRCSIQLSYKAISLIWECKGSIWVSNFKYSPVFFYHFPLNWAGRFCKKAKIPSPASCVAPKTSWFSASNSNISSILQ